MNVVSDTSPLNYLVLIGAVDVIPQLYAGLLLPPAVREELLDPGAPAVVRSWAEHLPP